MWEAWRPLLLAHYELGEWARTRDPVAAEPSCSAERKKATRRAAGGTPLHSFRTLLKDLENVLLDVCSTKGSGGRATDRIRTLPAAERGARPCARAAEGNPDRTHEIAACS